MQKLFSIDIKADFGLLKKPDTNEPVYLTFNMIHKPALLGIFGAIIGLEGFKKNGELPEYYEKLKDLKIGIQPLKHESGNYQKTVITYNNTTGMASDEQGGNLMVSEQTLIAPSFRIFILTYENEYHQKLHEYLKENKAEYLPYLGKNDFSLWWDNYNEYDFKPYEAKDSFSIDSIFIKTEKLKGKVKEQDPFELIMSEKGSFIYFENLPIGYQGKPLFQYEYSPFAFTDYPVIQNFKVENLYELNNNEKVQLF
jgi:CRISPR-associated protein Cas5h